MFEQQVQYRIVWLAVVIVIRGGSGGSGAYRRRAESKHRRAGHMHRRG
jgi:hypothetical protein